MTSLSAVTWSPSLLPTTTTLLLDPSPSPTNYYPNDTAASDIAFDISGESGRWVGVPSSMRGEQESTAMAPARNDSWSCPMGNETCGSSLSKPQCTREEGQPGTFIIAQILYVLVFVVGLGGNTLVIYVVLRYSKMQTVTNMYIVNLAIADEFFLTGIPFLLTVMNMDYWPFGSALCKIYMATTSVNQFTSSIFLTIMSADRYVAVCHPISAPCVRTPFVSKVVALAAWTASALLTIPVFMYASMTGNSCNILWPESGKMDGLTAFTIYTFILGFFIPLMLIFVFYCLVILRLRTVGPRYQQKKHAEASDSGIATDVNSTVSAAGARAGGEQRRRSHRKVTRLVLTVIAVYVFCWLPYWVTQLTLVFTTPKDCPSPLWLTIFLLAGCLGYSNSAVNPVLYAFLSDNFKKSFVKACMCTARSDINAALHLENSVFPRRNRKKKKSLQQRRSLPLSSGNQPTATAALAPYDAAGDGHQDMRPTESLLGVGGEYEGGMWRGAGMRLSSMEPSTAITMASRSNASADGREGGEEAVDMV